MDVEVYYTLIFLITRWQVLSFWGDMYVSMSQNKSQGFLTQYMPQDWFKCLRKKGKGRVGFSPATARRKKPKKSLSSNWVENLADSNKGPILRPGAMADGVERAAKHRMRPLGFHMNIQCKAINWKLRLKNLLKIWKAHYHRRWKTAGEDQQISDLTTLLPRKRSTCGKFTNYVPLGCSSARTKAVCLTKLRNHVFHFWQRKKAGRLR